MTTIQLKAEIHQMVDEMPENRVSEVFDYLKSVQYQSPSKEELKAFADRVLREDAELLRRLAQ